MTLLDVQNHEYKHEFELTEMPSERKENGKKWEKSGAIDWSFCKEQDTQHQIDMLRTSTEYPSNGQWREKIQHCMNHLSQQGVAAMMTCIVYAES